MTGGDEDQFEHGGEHAAFGADHDTGASPVEHGIPGLQEGDHLPWLDSADDDLDEVGVDAKRVWAFVLAGLALLVLIVGGVWWTTHRGSQGTQVADGSTVAAPPGAIKEAPANPGGKTFEGTGDSSFAVSQGHSPGVNLAAGGGDAAAVDAGAKAGPARGGAAKVGAAKVGAPKANAEAGGDTAGGVGVQVGAYSTQAGAEAGWARLSKTYDALSGTSHRVVEGKADIGTVYRLQAVAGSDDAAGSLCSKLKAAGLNCQVKD